MNGITWEQFLREITIIHNISQELDDKWTLIHANGEPGGIYLSKTVTVSVTKRRKSLSSEDESFECFEDGFAADESNKSNSHPKQFKQFLRIEYHVLYHISYAVPYLCFNAYTSSGTLLNLDGAWEIFNDSACNQHTIEMRNVLTQMEHPILFRPFLTLHPCRTAEVLQQLPNSKNKVLSFLSSYGTAIYLEFDLRYAQFVDDQIENGDVVLEI